MTVGAGLGFSCLRGVCVAAGIYIYISFPCFNPNFFLVIILLQLMILGFFPPKKGVMILG